MKLEIKPFSKGIFTLDASLTKNTIGRRMTIIQLSHGGLALHSPIYLEGKAKSSLEKLGNIEYILVPNEWHTLDVLVKT